MGCRTRVFENVAGEKSSLGRGNLSFTTLNMPRLAIEARIKAENLIEDERNKDVPISNMNGWIILNRHWADVSRTI